MSDLSGQRLGASPGITTAKTPASNPGGRYGHRSCKGSSRRHVPLLLRGHHWPRSTTIRLIIRDVKPISCKILFFSPWACSALDYKRPRGNMCLTRGCGMATFMDYGGFQRLRNIKGNHRGRCLSCGRQQAMTKLAWARRTRPLCKHCGGVLEPSMTAQSNDSTLSCAAAPPRQEHRCSKCLTRLNQYNCSDLCGACSQEAASEFLEHARRRHYGRKHDAT
jgi:hypothetical protein